MLLVGVVGGVAALVAGVAAASRAAGTLRAWSPLDVLLLVLMLVATGEALTAAGVLVWSPPLGHALLVASGLTVLLIGVETAARLGERVALPALRAGTGVAVVVLIALCALGGPDGPVPDPVWRSPAAAVAFWSGLAAAHVAIAAYLLVIVTRLLARLQPGPMRQATALVAAGAGVGVLYGLCAALLAGDARWWDAGFALLGFEIGSVSYVLVAAACCRVQSARIGRRTADVHLLRALGPLWHELRAAEPGILLGEPPALPEALPRAELGMTCVRAGVEIRDAMAALACRLPADAWQQAVTAAGDGADAEAAAAAGWIRAALASPPRIGRPRVVGSCAPPEGADIDDDLDQLVHIAQVPRPVADRIASDIAAPAGREWAR